MNESYNEPDVTVMDGLKKRPLGPLGPKLIAIAVLKKLYYYKLILSFTFPRGRPRHVHLWGQSWPKRLGEVRWFGQHQPESASTG